MRDSWQIIVDFDGTLTETDTEFFVAQKLLPPEDRRLKALFDAYEAIEIRLLDYFQAYLKLIDIESAAFFDTVAQTPIRSDLVALIRTLEEEMPVTIVSEGLDVYIAPLLARHGLADLPLVCNSVIRTDGGHRIVQSKGATSCERCLSCKGALVRKLKSESPRKVAVIGNGASDLCAAKEADAVFARDSLARLCRANKIGYTRWTSAKDIAVFFKTFPRKK